MLGLDIRAEITELRTELRDEVAGVRTGLRGGAMVSISGITFAANAVF